MTVRPGPSQDGRIHMVFPRHALHPTHDIRFRFSFRDVKRFLPLQVIRDIAVQFIHALKSADPEHLLLFFPRVRDITSHGFTPTFSFSAALSPFFPLQTKKARSGSRN